MTVVLYECGICDCCHPWDWDGYCREDANRYADAEDYVERNNLNVMEVEVRSMDDRIAADEADYEIAAPEGSED